ncbi:isocitrate lyase/PEP mutase family protein [Alphaproteobacteria bacterium KMM 3653]|uniref:Isocitrate lyase/PEP mutase family protein n=1 Tax=Harenicola maris TaxID=2841044 RepID=A0AAP2G876_9RHOB|nr:isocitrate lyase/PEP mutase family protein [Harenicola maris]
MGQSSLRGAIESGSFLVVPGVFDLISALMADRLGFPAIFMTGYGIAASHMGLPDAGLTTYSDMLGRAAQISARTRTPLIADADTGFGGLLNVRHTVRGYEDAGVAAIQIEDQEFPKKCGHTPGRRVIPTKDMLRKIEVAVDSRRSDDFLVIARTDARGCNGLDDAIARGRAFAKAGADVVFVESPEDDAEMARIAAEIEAPVMVNMMPGGSTPIRPKARLEELGFRIAIHPGVGFLSAGAAMDAAFRDLAEHGETTGAVALHPFADFNALMGFDEIHAFEKRFAETE